MIVKFELHTYYLEEIPENLQWEVKTFRLSLDRILTTILRYGEEISRV